MRSFEYDHDFPNRSADEVCTKILAWLQAENAKIGDSKPAEEITATHGSLWTVLAWKRNAKKDVKFVLSKTPDGTRVHVVTVPSSKTMYADDVRNMENEIFINWGLLLDEVWAYVDGKATSSPGDFTAAAKQLAEENKVAGKKLTIYGLAIVIVAISLVFLTHIPGLSVFGVVGSLMVFLGVSKLRYGSKKDKNERSGV